MSDRRPLALLILVLLACYPGFAAQSASPADGPTKTYKLEGVVVNAATGKPIPRALVQMLGVTGRAMLAGPEGEFSFDALPVGLVRLMVTKPGFFRPGAGSIPTSPVSAVVGPDAPKVVVKMIQECVIAGQVLGKDDEPLEGVLVQVFTSLSGYRRGGFYPIRGNTSTDEDGNFRIANLVPARYYLTFRMVSVTRRSLGAQAPKVKEGYPPIVYYPSGSDPGAAEALNLTSGQRMQVRLAVKQVPVFKVSGKLVVQGQWKQVSPPIIVDQTGQPLITPEEFDQATGAFEFRSVPTGEYTLLSVAIDEKGVQASSSRKVVVEDNIAGLTVPVRPGVDIPVIAHMESTRPAQPMNCTFYSGKGEMRTIDCANLPAANVQLRSEGSFRSASYSSAAASSDDPASPRTLRGVSPGRYHASASPTRGGYVYSMHCGVTDLLREDLVVPESGSVPPIEIVVRDDSATLKVRVRADQLADQVALIVFPDPVTGSDPVMMTATSPGSEVQSPPLAPGNYKVFVFDTDNVQFWDPEVLAKYSSQAASVTLAANGNTSVTADIIRTGD